MYLTHGREKSIHTVWRGRYMLRPGKSLHLVSRAILSLGLPPCSLVVLSVSFVYSSLSSKLLINQGLGLNSLSSSTF